MQNALHFRTTVQPGGRVEFASPHLEAGQTVDVVVSPTPTPPTRPAQPVTQEPPYIPPSGTPRKFSTTWQTTGRSGTAEPAMTLD